MKFSRALIPLICGFVLLTILSSPVQVMAQDNEGAQQTSPTTEDKDGSSTEAEEKKEAPMMDQLAYAIDNIFLLIAAVLVLFMQAGFAMVEAGFNAAKNAVNILFKNLIDVSLGVLLFWLVGFGLMYPSNYMSEEAAKELSPYFAFGGTGIYDATDDVSKSGIIAAPGKLFPQVDFLFQAAFAATAATIVSGAVAGRMQFKGYLIYSAILTAVIYPISGYLEMGWWLARRRRLPRFCRIAGCACLWWVCRVGGGHCARSANRTLLR